MTQSCSLILLIVSALVVTVSCFHVNGPALSHRWLSMTSASQNDAAVSLAQFRRQAAGLVFGASLSIAGLNAHLDSQGRFALTPEIAHADSTGKFSSKMTAKKRYIPRIKSGQEEFRALSKSLNAASVSAYLTGEKSPSEKLVRAMDLYGLSLRKGEYPDDISREAEKLTKVFEVEVKKLGSAKDLPAQYKAASAALDKYLDFAKLDEADK